MKRALVTGGCGFIGFHMAKYLAKKGVEVTVIDDLSRGQTDLMFNEFLSLNNVIFIQADMRSKDFYEKLKGYYDYVYHFAAINGTKYFYEKSYQVLQVNILSLINLLEWCKKENCGGFLFASSSEGYAGTINSFFENHHEFIPTQENIPLTIDDVTNARFSYGGSKITGELLTINYCRNERISYKIVRYHNIYGPRMGFEHVLPEFIKRIYDRQDPFLIYGGEETRAFCYIGDAICATEAVMLSEKCDNEIIHIGNSKEEIKIIDLLNTLLNIADYHPMVKVEAAPKGCVIRRCPNTNKLKDLTGFEALINLDKGLKIIYDWYIQVYAKLERNEQY